MLITRFDAIEKKSNDKEKESEKSNKNFQGFLKQMKDDADTRVEEAEKQEEHSKRISNFLNTLGARIESLEIKVSNSANDAESPTKK